MREERSPVFVRLPRICHSSTGVPAECDLHLVWNGRGYATQPLHRPGAPSQRYAFGRENLLVEGPADCQREGGGVVAEVAVRVDCEELEEAREVALRQIGVDYGDRAPVPDTRPERSDRRRQRSKRVAPFGCAVIRNDYRCGRPFQLNVTCRVLEQRQGRRRTGGLHARATVIGTMTLHWGGCDGFGGFTHWCAEAKLSEPLLQ
jgi:hypothetical protein